MQFYIVCSLVVSYSVLLFLKSKLNLSQRLFAHMNADEMLTAIYYTIINDFTYNYASDLFPPVFDTESGNICSEYSRAVVFSSSLVFRPCTG